MEAKLEDAQLRGTPLKGVFISAFKEYICSNDLFLNQIQINKGNACD